MDSNEVNSDEKIAVILPCYNEAAAIESVIISFKNNLPSAEIHVFDNNSSDNTATIAESCGAIVHNVSKRGKGNVVKAMFRDVEADYYIMADGDGTYPAEYAPRLLNVITTTAADMVIGNRMKSYGQSGSRSGHYAGNRWLVNTVNYLFDSEISDLLSGYRVLSRRFVKSIPLFSKGFEVETAMSIHAIEVDAKVIEVPIDYLERAEGTQSKLNTFSDGFKIAFTIFNLFKDKRPKTVYGFTALLFFLAGLIIGVPVIFEFMDTGLVERFPSAILASGLMIVGFLFAFTGLILSSIAKTRREVKKISFISMK